jgi:hypothetical protein
MTGQYNEYDPGAAVPLIDPGGTAWYDGTHNNDDEAFISKFVPVPLSITTANSNFCACDDTATAIPACGVEPYSYLWSDGQTTQTAINLCEGDYEVIVTDADCNIDTAYVSIICALPVELMDFTATQTGMDVRLEWTTASELNAGYFTLYRQTGESDFTEIAVVPAHGTSTSSHHYAFLDPSPGSGINYYKLTETDVNGHAVLETVISLEFVNGNNKFFAYPAGPNTIAVVYNTDITGVYKLTIYDQTGHQLVSVDWHVTAGHNYLPVSIPTGSAGIYIISVLTGEGPVTTRCIN